jgi:predicted dehydrogenase
MDGTLRDRDAAGGTTRRDFLRQATAASAAIAVTASVARGAAGANDRFGVGFIGTGGRAQAHLHEVANLKKGGYPVDIVAVYDAYKPRATKAAERFGAKLYAKIDELLADPNVNVVCVATPDHHHGAQAIAAVKAGKDVYCEKPVTHWRQFEVIKALAAEVKKSGRVFQLGTQGMSDGAWHQMRKLVQDGLIGQPIHAECGYFRVGDWGERGMPIDDKNAVPGTDLDWDAFLGDAPKRPFDVSRYFRWRMYEDYAGGPVTDLFPHSFTPVAYILGVKFPCKVVATGGMFRYTEREIPDTFNMLIDYPEKITVAVLGTQGNNICAIGNHGAGGRIPEIRGWDGSLIIQGNEIVFLPAEGSKKKGQRFPIERGEGGHWQNFLDCCKARNPQTNSPVDLAYHVQTAMIMGMLSYRNEKVAKFDAAKEEIVMA